MSNQAVLALENLEKSFGKNQVLKGVSFKLYPGKVTALLGANGAGKSTLIKVLAGLYPPSGGNILVGNTPARSARPCEPELRPGCSATGWCTRHGNQPRTRALGAPGGYQPAARPATPGSRPAAGADAKRSVRQRAAPAAGAIAQDQSG